MSLATARLDRPGGCVLLATILRRRAPGMTLLRMPVFTLDACSSTCLMVVVLVPGAGRGDGALLLADRHGGVLRLGRRPVSYQHLFWFYGHPAVYVMFFPFVGMVAEVDRDVLSGRRFFGYRAFVALAARFTALSMSVWGHHMFTTGPVADELLRADLDGAGRPRRHRVLRHRSATMWGGAIALRDADALRARLPACSSCRRAERHLGRLAAARLPRARLLLRRRALPLHAASRAASSASSPASTSGGRRSPGALLSRALGQAALLAARRRART